MSADVGIGVGGVRPAVDLGNCDREPIHIPGSIQPHGVLLAVTVPSLEVVIASANCASWFDGAPVVGRSVREVLGAGNAALLGAALRAQWSERYDVALDSVVGDHLAVLHRTGGLLVVEIEAGSAGTPSSTTVRDAALALQASRDVHSVADASARFMRTLLGFDRVMVYRFDEDWHGEVIAEAKLDSLNSFFGLHYPATDIPVQARELYRRNWVRSIPDIDYTPVPLLSSEGRADGASLDLSASILRSVSPIHVEYLSNMGVHASMSISLIVNGELWGLIACHHYAGSRYTDVETRNVAEHLGQLISLRLAETLDAERRARSVQLDSVADSVVHALADAVDGAALSNVIGDHEIDVLRLAAATGAVFQTDDARIVIGAVPPPEAIAEIIGCWPTDAENYSTADLREACPRAEVSGGAAIFPLTPDRAQYAIWFRPELVQTVEWGGDPRNAKIAEREGDRVRLSPRKSFDRWREIVRGRSQRWSDTDLDAASRFTRHLGAALLRTKRETSILARDLQRVMRPEQLPAIEGLELSAVSMPAGRGEIGGDWHDAVVIGGRLALVIGDVAGHGLVAASEMAQLRNALRAYLVEDPDPSRVLERLDRFMHTVLPGSIATVVYALIDPATGVVTISHAGHVPTMTRHGSGVSTVSTVGDRLLGVAPIDRHVTEVQLQPDDLLVMYSDGLVESRRLPLDQGMQQLEAAIGTLAVSDETDDLAGALVAQLVDVDHEDDVTLLVVRRVGP